MRTRPPSLLANVLACALLAMLFTALSTPVAAANDPGHDTLYVVKLGDSNVTGGINISNYLRVGNLFYTSYLDLQGNGTQPGNGNAEIYATSGKALNLNAPGNLYLLPGSGTMVYVGGSNVALNVSGTAYVGGALNVTGAIYEGNKRVCLADGTNCAAIGGSSSGGGWTNTSTLVYTTTYTNNVGIGTNQPNYTLDVYGNARVSGSIINYATLAQTAANIGNYTSERSAISTNITNLFSINNSWYTNVTNLQSNSGAYYKNITDLQQISNLSLHYNDFGNYSAERAGLYTNDTNLRSINNSWYTNVTNLQQITNYSAERVPLYVNVTNLLSINNSWYANVTNMNTSKAQVANCPTGQIVQNTTATGVQCIAAAAGSGNVTTTGAVTNGYLALFNSTSTIGNSAIVQNGNGSIGIGTTMPSAFFHINKTYTIKDESAEGVLISFNDTSTVEAWSNKVAFRVNQSSNVSMVTGKPGDYRTEGENILVQSWDSIPNDGTGQQLTIIGSTIKANYLGPVPIDAENMWITGIDVAATGDLGTNLNDGGIVGGNFIASGSAFNNYGISATAAHADNNAGAILQAGGGVYGTGLSVSADGTSVAYGINVASVSGAGNKYGVYIGSVVSGGTSSWDLYAADATSNNYFAGKVGIGTDQPNTTLNVKGTANITGALSANGSYVCTQANGLCGGGTGNVTTTGVAQNGYIPMFNSTGTIGNSAIAQTGAGFVGIGTAVPGGKFHVVDTNANQFQLHYSYGSPTSYAGAFFSVDSNGNLSIDASRYAGTVQQRVITLQPTGGPVYTGGALSTVGNLNVLGTANTVAGTTNFDTGTLFVDGTNNRVGVNTPTPNATLTVYSSANGGSFQVINSLATNLFVNGSSGNVGVGGATAPSIKLAVGTDAGTGLNSTAAGVIGISTYGTDRLNVNGNTGLVSINSALYVEGSANVSVGSTNSPALLTVGAVSNWMNISTKFAAVDGTALSNTANSMTYPFEFEYSTGNTNRLLIGGYRRGTGSSTWANSSWRIQSAVDSSFTAYNTGKAYIEFANTGGAGFGTTGYLFLGTEGADRLTIDGSGNVGIGTTTPNQLLTVNGGDVKILVNGSTAGAIRMAETSGTQTYFEWQSYNDILRLNSDTTADLITIQRSGRVGMNTTQPNYTLDVYGQINAPTVCIAGTCQTSWPSSSGAAVSVSVG